MNISIKTKWLPKKNPVDLKITICTEDVTDFKGDVIIIPCDSKLTNHKVGIVPKILDQGGKGYCEVGQTYTKPKLWP